MTVVSVHISQEALNKEGHISQRLLKPNKWMWGGGVIVVGHPFFSKERNVLAFFYVLYKRMRHTFTFFIKEWGVLCVLLRSL